MCVTGRADITWRVSVIDIYKSCYLAISSLFKYASYML